VTIGCLVASVGRIVIGGGGVVEFAGWCSPGVVTAVRVGPVVEAAVWERVMEDLVKATALPERRRRAVTQPEQLVQDLTEQVEKLRARVSSRATSEGEGR